MSLFSPEDLHVAETVSKLDYANPFLSERVELERIALGADFVPYPGEASVRALGKDDLDVNTARIMERADEIIDRTRVRLVEGHPATERERELYEDVGLFWLYHRFHLEFRRWIHCALDGEQTRKVEFYPDFEDNVRHILFPPGVTLPHDDPPEHLFSFFFQMNRAFVNIFHYLVGSSQAAARLRGSIWQSIFTHDLRRYRRVMFERMSDIPTLITGPSGTGKELVARAIGLARYIPFDPQQRAFREDFTGQFHALNLSAMSPTLIESEMFGHKKGAFTGALEDRQGWFEVCGATGCVFLDEVGDVEPAIQVKLLRVLQTREFQRLGEVRPRKFSGKIIAATNRDLGAAMRDGSFRQDLYYRVCADHIVTPSLIQQIGSAADELRELIHFISERMAGAEAESLTTEVMDYVERDLGLDYHWPGNFRELEQCVRNVLIRKEYRPTMRPRAAQGFLEEASEGLLTAEQLLRGYCKLMYEKTGSYSEAARRLELDRRTVKAKVEFGEGDDS